MADRNFVLLCRKCGRQPVYCGCTYTGHPRDRYRQEPAVLVRDIRVPAVVARGHYEKAKTPDLERILNDITAELQRRDREYGDLARLAEAP